MKTLKLTVTVIGLVLLGTTELWAAGGAREDSSGFFVWAFLGICALIVTAQVVPALFMLFGAAKGIAESIKEHQKVAVTSEGKSH